MEILLAKSAGFCFGVQRAVDTAYEHADEENVYTYGQIIHNEEVVGDLTKHGVQVNDSDDELLKIKDSKVISDPMALRKGYMTFWRLVGIR